MGDERVVGIDVGGTKILAVAVDRADPSTVLARHVTATPRTPADLLAAIVGSAREVGVDARVGIGLAGLVDDGGVLRAAPNLGWMIDEPVAGPVATALGIDPPAIDNDANCALRSELAHGAAREASDVVLVSLGTGIGGAIAIDGRVVRGAHGFAGEPGHMLVDPEGPECPCGRIGCWERYASGAGLARLAREAGLGEIRGEEVVARARRGDPAAAAVVDRFSWWVAAGLASIADLLDPDRLVIGGGLSADADLWIDRVRVSFTAQTLGGAHRSTRIVAAATGPSAGAIGAALRAMG